MTSASILALYACNKPDILRPKEGDNGCIERIIVPVTGHSVSNTDVVVINTLFTNNGIDWSKYRYYQYINDSTQTYFPPYAKFDDKVVKVDQYTNGLKIFTGQLVFEFRNNIFSYMGGYPTAGTNLNTTPELKPAQLRKLFIGHIEQFDYTGNQYNDSCFRCEFGYFNINAGSSYSTENLVKAWSVTLKNRTWPSEYPIAYYQDSDGKLIYYDNGIQTFNQTPEHHVYFASGSANKLVPGNRRHFNVSPGEE